MELEHSIENIAFKLPDLPPASRKNLFDILGIRNKEVLNSRILGYFFNSNEEHGLGTLFFDSLCDLISENLRKEVAFEPSFHVLIEESTSKAILEENRRKSIDLLLEGEDWAIIIENKLYHHLNNPLDVYVEHVRHKENIIGVVLSIHQLGSDITTASDFRYVNITHSQLIERVQSSLKLGNNLSSTSLFYLNEYFKTIQSHEQSKMEKPVMNEIVSVLVNQRNNFRKIQEKVSAAEAYITEIVDEYFFKRNYDKTRDLYFHRDFPDLYFWVHPSQYVLKENYLKVHFEAQGKLKELVADKQKNLEEYFQKLDYSNRYLNYGTEGQVHCFHLLRYNNSNFLKPGQEFSEAFKNEMDKIFFSRHGMFSKTIHFLNQEVNYQSVLKSIEVNG